MVQVVTCRALIAETPIRSQVSPCEMCGVHSGIQIDFIRVLRFSPACIIPPIPLTRLHLSVALTGRTNGRSLGTFKTLFRKSGCSEWDTYLNLLKN